VQVQERVRLTYLAKFLAELAERVKKAAEETIAYHLAVNEDKISSWFARLPYEVKLILAERGEEIAYTSLLERGTPWLYKGLNYYKTFITMKNGKPTIEMTKEVEWFLLKVVPALYEDILKEVGYNADAKKVYQYLTSKTVEVEYRGMRTPVTLLTYLCQYCIQNPIQVAARLIEVGVVKI